VIATQNPHEAEGTFPLIEAQRDRFMFSAVLTHLDAENELEVIRREQAGELDWRIYHDRIGPVLSPADVAEMAATLRQIRIDKSVMAYIRDLVTATRLHSDIRLGASSRASIAFVRGSRVLAALNGRDYVIPDDVRELAHPVFRHRLLLTREATITGLAVDAVIDEILESVEVS
ncbi:MAG TPA: MoxR family ATPase, partial [Methanoculleus sp.]|nr:MoxR family ATPase [Methanoculleus sp.]